MGLDIAAALGVVPAAMEDRPRRRRNYVLPAQSVGKSSRAWAVSGCVAGMPGPVEHRRSSDGPQRCWVWFLMVSGSRTSL